MATALGDGRPDKEMVSKFTRNSSHVSSQRSGRSGLSRVCMLMNLFHQLAVLVIITLDAFTNNKS